MLKRTFDIILSFNLLLIFSPLIVLLCALVRLKLGSPVFFRQKRPGKNGRIFEMVKFRTMTDHKNNKGELLPDKDRLTPFGQFLRSTSLDELPELWNVLKGDMSFVGPRPLLVSYLDRYSPDQARRHECKPGLTGWAQINGRNATSWEDRFRMDVWYVDHQSFFLDLKIIFLTFFTVIKREGVSHSEHSTMPEFKPTSDRKDSI